MLLPQDFSTRKVQYKISPVQAFELLYKSEPYAFLYESLEQKGERGRYSFIGAKPFLIIRAKGNRVVISDMSKRSLLQGNPFTILRQILNSVKIYSHINPFSGGAVGYVAYDAIRYFEKIPDNNPDRINLPDLFFIFPQELVLFDHKKKSACIISYNSDKNRLSEISNLLTKRQTDRVFKLVKNHSKFHACMEKSDFCSIVKKAKEYILAGDIFQVVLSQRFMIKINKPAFDVYQALRITNPSPYMYYLNLDDIKILGSSPEILVKLKNKTAISRPLAGTRKRGRSLQEDKMFERELLNDEKERAEHIMLVDLARNDLGRVCIPGSVRTTELMKIERYSRVMHIVSNVKGRLRNDLDAIDLFSATFPAGTVSGAPKIRAMEIIDELESVKRGLYAGAIGYFDFSGNMDFCIAIRTILIRDSIAYLQAGAGIVADSIPENEHNETLNKIKALKNALEIV